jgi:hypothetical protein
MKSYILPAADSSLKERLNQAGIKFFDWMEGIILEGESDMTASLQALGMLATEHETEFADLVQLRLYKPTEPVANQEDEARSRSRDNYIKACSACLKSRRKAASDAAASVGENLPEKRAAFFSAVRAEFLNQEGTNIEAYLAHQWQMLRTTSGALAVQCLPGKVLVDTDTVYTTSPQGGRFELGRFRLEINLDGDLAGLVFINSSRRVDGFKKAMHAPHVFANGRPCFEEIEQVLLELVARFELATVVEIALQFLESAAEDPFHGRFAQNWPRAD